MGYYDEYRSKWKMQKKDKNIVIRNVAKYLTTLWQSELSSVEILTEDQICTKIKGVLIPIEKKISSQKFSRARSGFDLNFIKKEKNNARYTFDISKQKSTTKKRKADEMVCKIAYQFLKYLYLLPCLICTLRSDLKGTL